MSSEAISYFPNSVSESHANERSTTSSKMDSASDEALLIEIGAGSKVALGRLYDRLARSVYSVAVRILRDEAEAEDLVHEIFLLVHRTASQFDPEKGSARTWIIHAAYMQASNRRAFLNVRGHYESAGFVPDLVHASLSDSEQVCADRVTARRLMDRFHEVLSPDQRRTLEMHLFQGSSFREIAEEFRVPVDTIRRQYYRGCERLRALISEQKDAPRV